MKGMIGIREQVQRRALAELFDEGPQKLRVRKLIASSLEEQHRGPHVEEVFPAFVRWPAGGMKRESKEGDAPDTR